MEMVVSDKQVSDSVNMIAVTSPVVSSDENVTNVARICGECRTTKTPLWRSGPSGPKSLCNACGIRCVKKKRDLLGLSRKPTKKKAAAPGKAVAPAKAVRSKKDKASTSGESVGSDEAKKEERVKREPADMYSTTDEVEIAALILMSLRHR
ncbi:GATA transcription factor 23-like [Impatiens glandulifera]|uniref:GATA transcription factor 23-like n=1 Tax=Impatiens glandulifera TaxID=253017 RepID=UPI001FB06ABC|nr:GATA transcription factor 23-like [Impatiens glandulifera]